MKNLSQKFKSTVEKIADIDRKAEEFAQARLDSLTKPLGSLGRLEELAKQIAAVTGVLRPDFSKKLIIVMAADHGVVEEGVSAYPKEVTPQMVYNFLSGGAAINVLSRHVGADVAVVDIGVAEELKGAVKLSDLAEILSTAGQKGKEKIEGAQDLSKNVSDFISIIDAKNAKNAEIVKKHDQMASILIDKKVAYGTSNMAKGAAMTEEQAFSAVEAGIEV
ncbi:MAG: nicotinate-nucleotide--dimethylbenzimidazole phosphoribosyltransferase, partial [Actinobacteria bacterium]|nr:nicotinate-nucleotide--dimethylbenzimidazole phosphoribosyltransferase [Actinomycetota bacterium]